MNSVTETSNPATSVLLRTLFITQHLPFPPMGGAPLRNWQNINLMHRFGPVGVLCLPTVPQEFDSSQLPIELPVWCIQPDPSRENAISKLTPRLRQLGWLLNQASAYRDKYFTREASQKLERILKEFQPDVIVFEEVWLYSYLSQLKGRDYTLILDAHNVEAALFRQIYNATKSQGLLNRLDTGIRLALIEAMERNFVQQVHQVWACSDHDATLLTHATAHASKKLTPIKVVPNGVDVSYYSSVRSNGSENRTLPYPTPEGLHPNPHTLIFTASFSYAPNAVAAQFLVEQIYPQLKQAYPECRVLLVGTNPTEFMQKAAHHDPNIIVTGRVPDIRSYLAVSSVVIVPLLQGGGTRLKILEAFAAGRPVVSTTKGAEGLNVQHGEQLLIADTAEELVVRVCQLWENLPLSHKLTQSAWKFIQTNYAWEAVAQNVEQAVQQLLSTPASTNYRDLAQPERVGTRNL